ncbi:HEAT repeat domain-containing protein [Streptomyces bugieae]|uniref:HEAT repeat domain-containing protein n=1 Tax=Streptomyces bugieae TaxID=3098223 RepID=A0ABU7NVW2_9ACTN|nr:HEAT repeat domain-containing protein [Streptomyces sp. DSM 41528]
MTTRTPGQDPASAPSTASGPSNGATPSTAPGPDHPSELTAAVLDGSVLSPGTPARTAVFEAVGADPDGPVTRELLALARHVSPAVRRTVLTLLGELTHGRTPWPAPVEAAGARLHDPDPDVRRAAARLLVRTGAADRARTALGELTDPVTRIALADALLGTPGTSCPPGPLRTDPLPEIRLLGCLEELATAPREQWPELDAQTLAEVTALTAHDADRGYSVGSRWGRALYRQEREADCYATAPRLLAGDAGAYGRRVGVQLAHRAFQEWRAAPDTLAPHLVRLLPTAPPDLRTLVVHALCASRTATRRSADALAALLPDPTTAPAADPAGPGAGPFDAVAWEVTYALATTGDPRAAPYVHALLTAGARPPGMLAALRGLLRAGAADTGQLAAYARTLLRSDTGDARSLALGVLDALDPAAAAPCVPDLLTALRNACETAEARGAALATWPELSLVGTLGRIGPPAAAAVPLLTTLTRDSRRRPGHGALALARITGDRAPLETYLRTHPPEGRRPTADHSALFQWLLDHGGLDPEQSARLRGAVLGRGGAMQVRGSLVLWRNEGPPVAAELLAVLPDYLDDDLFGPVAMTTLAAMGPHARPALPHLRALIDRRTRLPLHAGSEDADLRADEQLLEAAERTAAALTGGDGR